MLKCGLLGEKLGHSYSPAIHAELTDYEYKLYERAPEEVEAFLLGTDCKADMCAAAGRCGCIGWDGLNVTIPYKQAAAACCAGAPGYELLSYDGPRK